MGSITRQLGPLVYPKCAIGTSNPICRDYSRFMQVAESYDEPWALESRSYSRTTSVTLCKSTVSVDFPILEVERGRCRAQYRGHGTSGVLLVAVKGAI